MAVLKYLDENGNWTEVGLSQRAITPEEIGALPSPVESIEGQILTYNGKSWEAADVPEDSVKSVNGQTGDVQIELPEIEYPVTSVNGQMGDVIIETPDLSNTIKYNYFSTIMNKSQDWRTVVYGKDKFVAVGSYSIAYSYDGISWTEAPTSLSKSYPGWNALGYGNGIYVALEALARNGGTGGSTFAAYSTDGINWIETSLPSKQQWVGACYGNGMFVSLAYDEAIAAYSYDGQNWNEANMPNARSWRSITYGNGKFVAVSDSSIIAYSEDGIAWSELSVPVSCNSITYGNGMFVGVSYGTRAMYSADGTNWTSVTLPRSSWNDITYGNGKFIAVGYKVPAIYTTDGATWYEAEMPSDSHWYTITYGVDKYVAIAYGSDVCAISYDGISWYISDASLTMQDGKDITQQVSDLVFSVQNIPEMVFSYGAEDLTAGTSVLESGRLYFVYE